MDSSLPESHSMRGHEAQSDNCRPPRTGAGKYSAFLHTEIMHREAQREKDSNTQEGAEDCEDTWHKGMVKQEKEDSMEEPSPGKTRSVVNKKMMD